MNLIEKYFNTLFAIGILLGLTLSFWYASQQILTGDQYQMLIKGYTGAYTGVWQSFGNAASAVGNVPGSLTSIIVGWPLRLWDSPWAPMILLISLRLWSFLLFDAVFKRIFSPEIRITFMLLYWLNPWFLFETLLYNPSYLFFFSALHFWSAYHMREKSSFVFTLIHVISIAMAMQMHYSWIILALISFYLFVRKIIHISWNGLFTALVLIVLSLIPYLQEYLTNETIRTNSGNKDGERYIGWGAIHVYPIFKAIFYWFRYASFIFSNKQVLGSTFDWISSTAMVQIIIVYLFRGLFYLIGILTLWIVWKANRYSWENIKTVAWSRNNNAVTQTQWVLLYALGAFMAILISAALSPIVFSHWHLIITFAFALFPIIAFVDNYLKNTPKHFSLILGGVFVYFLVINIIAINDSEKFSYKTDYIKQTKAYVFSHLKFPRD